MTLYNRRPSFLAITHLLLLAALVILFLRRPPAALDVVSSSNLHAHLFSNSSSPPLPLSNLYADEDDRGISIASYFAARPPPQREPKEPTYQFETFWTDADVDMKVCRVHNACVRDDGTVVVHRRLERNESDLRGCGFQRLDYLGDDEYKPSNVHLLGAMPVRDHMPHFLTDFAPAVRAVELIEPKFTEREQVRKRCERDGGECERVGLDPLVFYASERIEGQRIGSWVPMVKEMLLEGVGVYVEGSGGRCFESIVGYDVGWFGGLNGSRWLGERNPVFAKHGIDRGKRKGECKVKLLNRIGWTGRRGSVTGRDILNVGELEKQLGREMTTRIDVVYFEGMSVAEQAEVMQDADVIVAAHGAGLSNLVFAKQGAKMLEVLAFGYKAGPFEVVARVMGVDYEAYIAQPEVERVVGCLKGKGGEEDEELKEAIEMWIQGAKQYPRNKTAVQFELHPRFEVRNCARRQRMLVDGRKLVQWVKKAVISLCDKLY